MVGTRKVLCCVLMAFVALAVGGVCTAGVIYDEASNSIKVSDFPKEFACTPGRLLMLDGQFGWGKVTYNETTDTYTIACNLEIGGNDGTETYFQIGSVEHPKEILIMKGNLRVMPYFVEGENEGIYWKVPKLANRLTIGDPESRKVNAALKFDCETKNQYTIAIPGRKGWGGQICVYDSTITALNDDPAHRFGEGKYGNVSLGGDMVIFDNATYGGVSGLMMYGVGQHAVKTTKIVNTTFQNGGDAIIGGKFDFTGCTFRNLNTALLDYGGIDITVTNCTFENNVRNFSLRFSNKGIVCIDCNIGDPTRGDEFHSQTTRSQTTMNFPTLTSKRHIIVEVVDAAGKPVPGAEVIVRSEQDIADNIENYKHTTDAKGRTPGEGNAKAILLADFAKKNTETPNKPELKEFSYSIEVTAAGFAPGSVKGVRPTQSWQVVQVKLTK